MITKLRHDWPEKAEFLLSRPEGHPQYTFLHFATPVQLEVSGVRRWVSPGTCIFYAPGTPQWFYSQQALVHNWFHAGEDLAQLLEQYSIPADTPLYLPEAAFISELFQKMERELFSENAHKERMLDCYLQIFLVSFSRAVTGSSGNKTLDEQLQQRLRSLRQEILRQPEEKWSVGQMAQCLSVSTSRFHNIYRSMFGTSPMKDLIEARVDYGKSLLLSRRQMSVEEVAMRLGYNDQYHFIRQFRTVTGLTPGQYRKTAK